MLLKSGNLDFLEPCGPLQACNGTALPLQRVAEGSFLAEEEATQRTTLFWAVTQRVVVFFLSTFNLLYSRPLEMGPICCSETPVRNLLVRFLTL